MARPKTIDKELKDQRIPIMMTPSEVKALDDWMHKNRIRSRGDAIRRLCQIGLATMEQIEKIDILMREYNGAFDKFSWKIHDFPSTRLSAEELFTFIMEIEMKGSRTFMEMAALFDLVSASLVSGDVKEAIANVEATKAESASLRTRLIDER